MNAIVTPTKRPLLVRAWKSLTRPMRVRYVRFLLNCIDGDIHDEQVELWSAIKERDYAQQARSIQQLAVYREYAQTKRVELALILSE